MNSKKTHEVQSMSVVVACLAQRSGVKQVCVAFLWSHDAKLERLRGKSDLRNTPPTPHPPTPPPPEIFLTLCLHQVIDVGSGKGYLSSFLSLQYGLSVFGIDSSSTNTHGALERNRKLKKFSKAYQKSKTRAELRAQRTSTAAALQEESLPGGDDASQEEAQVLIGTSDVQPAEEEDDEDDNSRAEELFLSAFSADVAQTPSPRIPPAQLSTEEKERRKRDNLERKAQRRGDGDSIASFSPLTSYVTPQMELRELIEELRVRTCVWLRLYLHLHNPPDFSRTFRRLWWSGCTPAETWHPAR